MLIYAPMTSADLHRGYVWYDSANRKGFRQKQAFASFALSLRCFAASTVSDLVVTGSVLAELSISKVLLKEKNLWALLTFFSRKPGSSLQIFSYLISPLMFGLYVQSAGWFCSACRTVCWEPSEEKWYLQSSISAIAVCSSQGYYIQDLP